MAWLVVFLVLATLALRYWWPDKAPQLDGQVVAVADGDTLTILQDGERVRVRLAEIDAPESDQPFGPESTASLRALCAGKAATLASSGKDQYQRVVARVSCGGVDTSDEQVRRGLAWVYDSYVVDRSLYTVQDAARKAQRGLWADPAPVPPWQWRRGVRSASLEKAGAGTGSGAGQQAPQHKNDASAGQPVIGNQRSGVYHLPVGCPGYATVSPRNQVLFDSERAARAAGYRIAGNCRRADG